MVSNISNTIIFCSDFGARLNLAAKDTGNYSVGNHTAVCIVYLLYNQENVEYDEKQEDNSILTKTKRINSCDR